MEATPSEQLRCSFCGKAAADVTCLLAGGATPGVYICEACVDACLDIIRKAKASGTAP